MLVRLEGAIPEKREENDLSSRFYHWHAEWQWFIRVTTGDLPD